MQNYCKVHVKGQISEGICIFCFCLFLVFLLQWFCPVLRTKCDFWKLVYSFLHTHLTGILKEGPLSKGKKGNGRRTQFHRNDFITPNICRLLIQIAACKSTLIPRWTWSLKLVSWRNLILRLAVVRLI